MKAGEDEKESLAKQFEKAEARSKVGADENDLFAKQPEEGTKAGANKDRLQESLAINNTKSRSVRHTRTWSLFLKHHEEKTVERRGVVVKALWLSASELSQEEVLVPCGMVPDKGQEIVGRPSELGDVKRGRQEGVAPGVAPHSLSPLLTCALVDSPLCQDRAQPGSLCPPL